jgi:acetyl-CoA acetyltransferase
MHDVVLVVGGEKMPKGFIQTSGGRGDDGPEYLRQLCVGVPGPRSGPSCAAGAWRTTAPPRSSWRRSPSRRGRTAYRIPYARYRKEASVAEVMKSPLVSYPLRLFEICAVSDGAAAVVICSADVARPADHEAGVGGGQHGRDGALRRRNPAWTRRRRPARRQGVSQRGRGGGEGRHGEGRHRPTGIDLVELQDNTVYYELSFPEEWGFCEPGEAESLLERGDTLPTGRLPINPSGGFLSFGEATTAQGLFQVCEVGWQLRGDAGGRQVPMRRSGSRSRSASAATARPSS